MNMKSLYSIKSYIVLSLSVVLLLSLGSLSASQDSASVLFQWDLWTYAGTAASVIILLDFYSLIFMVTVGTISLAVFTFSKSYMAQETHFARFHLILLVFVASMFILILSPGLVSLLVGWDGLGLSSFLLVMYYSSAKSLNASLLTVMTNRLGDALILTALILGLSEQSFILSSWQDQGFSSTPWLAVLLVVGTFTKSAQVPFCAWLPAAMAAPTPVSSLVHSSTLVTAGVYIMIRLGGSLAPELANLVAVVGSLTMLLAGLSALGEGDMKKIVALSTLSQLGIMVVGVGAGFPLLAFFHLIAHAFFKALLFVGVGNYIHTSASYQDLKVMGGKASSLPLTSSVLVVAKGSLCGLPFFSGFFSKEAILENLETGGGSSVMLWFSMVMGILLTQLYTYRFILKVVVGSVSQPAVAHSHDTDAPTNQAMWLLLIPAFTGGAAFLSVAAHHTPFVVSPGESKSFVVSLFGLAAVAAWLLYRNEAAKAPSGAAPLGMWLLPAFSGQVPLPLAHRGDALQKALSLGFIDGLLGQWPLSSSLAHTAGGAPVTAKALRLALVGVVGVLLLAA